MLANWPVLKFSFISKVLALIVVALVATGCTTAPTPELVQTPATIPSSNNSDGNNSGGGSGSSANVLTWWGSFLRPEDVQPLIDRFESENPDIQVNYSLELNTASTDDAANYRSKLLDIVPDSDNPNSPDIFSVDSGYVGSMIPNASPAPSSIISAPTFRNNFYDFVSTDMVRQDLVYGVPLWVDTFALIYNKQMWSAAGMVQPDSDWNRFANDQVKKLTKVEGNRITQSGFSAGNRTNTEFWFEALNMFILQNRVEILDASGNVAFAQSNDSKVAVDFYRQFTTTNRSWDSTFNQDIASFLEKKLATYMAPSWRLSDVLKYNEAGTLNIDVAVAEVPQLKSSLPDKVNYAFYWTNMVNKNSSNTEAAWRFLNFMSQPSQLQELNSNIIDNGNSATGILYPRKDMNSLQISDRYLGVYARSLNNARSWFMIDEAVVRSAFSKLIDSSADLNRTQREINDGLNNARLTLGEN